MSYADLEDPWVVDVCSVIDRDDSCLDNTHEDCSVSVTVLVESDPVTLLCMAVGCMRFNSVVILTLWTTWILLNERFAKMCVMEDLVRATRSDIFVCGLLWNQIF